MLKSFKEILEKAKKNSQKKICLAAAHDEDALRSVIEAKKQGIASAILVGDKEKMLEIAKEIKCDLSDFEIIDEKDITKCAEIAVEQVSKGNADVLMKGLVQTSTLLKVVLNKEYGLRTTEILSHISVVATPKYEKLLFITDGGVNIAPDLEKKASILRNAIALSRSLGNEMPKAAILSAVELVNPDMPSTLDAANLSKMAERGQIKGCIVDGPLALDNAISLIAAKHKGIVSPVSGDVDILLCPNIEAGNIMVKALIYLAGCETGGIILGARCPIVLTSRSDTYETKLNSIAIAVAML